MQNINREGVLTMAFEVLHSKPQSQAIIAIIDPEQGFKFLSTSPDLIFQMGMIQAAEKAIDENYRIGMHDSADRQAELQARIDIENKKPGSTN